MHYQQLVKIKIESIPRTYIRCTLGPLSSWMEPFAARARKHKWNVHIMSDAHDVMITNPNGLAELRKKISRIRQDVQEYLNNPLKEVVMDKLKDKDDDR